MMRPKHWLCLLLALKASGLQELMGSVAQQLSSHRDRKPSRA